MNNGNLIVSLGNNVQSPYRTMKAEERRVGGGGCFTGGEKDVTEHPLSIGGVLRKRMVSSIYLQERKIM